MEKCPCKGCQERKEGCHSRCPSYIHWADEVRAAKEWCRKEKNVPMSTAAANLYYRRLRGK